MGLTEPPYIIPVFLPYLGCPGRCIYCAVDRVCLDPVKPQEIEDYVKRWVKFFCYTERRIEIGFYGGTFTNIPFELMNSYLTSAGRLIERGIIDGVRVSTRPDYIDRDTLEYLKKNHVKVMEIGVESFDDDVLMKSGRNYDSQTAFEGCEMVKMCGIELGIHLMVGLPGDDVERDMETAKKVIELRPETVRIHPTLVLRNTKLEEMFRMEHYQPLSLDSAVDIVSEMFIGFKGHGIETTRMGFFIPNDKSHEIVAGPHHPSFGNLVEYRAFGKILRWISSRYENFTVVLSRKRMDLLNGYGGKNRRLLSNLPGKLEIVDDDEIVFILDDIPMDYEVVMKKYFKERHPFSGSERYDRGGNMR